MRFKWIALFLVFPVLLGRTVFSEEAVKPLTLEESIKIALERNLRLRASTAGIAASEFRKKAAFTDFFPKWTGQYSYTRHHDIYSLIPDTDGSSSRSTSDAIATRDIFNFSTTLTQPVFTGGSISANYRTETLGVDLSRSNTDALKRDIVLQVREGYFNILTAEKLVEVAQQAVKQFEAQLEVARAFFDVGVVAKNDVLQAEVRLANARQSLVKAQNQVDLAKASFNNLLRQDINTPLSVVDILEYKPFTLRLEDCVGEALKQRPEIKAAELAVEQAKEAVKIAQSGYYPTISVLTNYNRTSDDFTLQSFVRTEKWSIQALATLTISDWWRLNYKVGESRVRVSQAIDQKNQLIDNIVLEVKQAYLNVLQAEKNIGVTEKAIEQAEENLRINEERYKYQVATATEVLDAVTLLAQARLNYFSALSDYNIARARLDRAMGRMFP